MAVGARQRGLSVDEVRTLIEWRFPRKDRGGDIGVQLVQANIPDRCGFAAARPRRQHGKFHSPPAYRPLPAAPICLYPRAVAWLSLLKIVRPAEAYVRQNRETGRHRAKRGAVWAKGPGWAAFGPPESKPPPGWVPPSRPFREGVDEGPSHWDERAREVEGTNRHAVERGAEELLRSGATVIPTSFGPVQARLIRFWTARGSSIATSLRPGTGTADRSPWSIGGNSRRTPPRASWDTSCRRSSPSTTTPTRTCGALLHPTRNASSPPEDGLLLQACDRDGTGCRLVVPYLGRRTSCHGGFVSGIARRSLTDSLTL